MSRVSIYRVLLCGLLLGAAVFASAQSYDISWYKIAGGGGTSSGTASNGTVYAISGTIGQPDAGYMAGGNYAIAGGFWGVIGAVQAPGVPYLTITAASPNVIISWAAADTGYTLEKNSNLTSTNWVTVGLSTNVVNGTNFVTVPASGGNMYFRLKQ